MAPFPSPTTTWHTKTHPSISPRRPELSAKGKTILITGGGTGIGAETAHSFAQAGASRIALLGRREQPLLDTKASIETKFPTVSVLALPTDITSQDEVNAAFAQFLGDDGNEKLHVLVSNAGLVGPMESVADVDSGRFLDAVQQTLQGALYVAQAFLRYAAKDAVVIDVNSNAAHVNYAPGMVAYSVAKMAVYRLWDSLGFGNPDMSVFHIQPGVVDTAMNREAGGVEAMGFSDDASLPASFNVWLASPEARFLKGKFLYANWDVDELKARAEEIGSSEQFNIGLGGWPFQDAGWTSTWKA